jgi:hypothetical protein
MNMVADPSNWFTIQAVARGLRHDGTLTSPQVRKIVRTVPIAASKEIADAYQQMALADLEVHSVSADELDMPYEIQVLNGTLRKLTDDRATALRLVDEALQSQGCSAEQLATRFGIDLPAWLREEATA